MNESSPGKLILVAAPAGFGKTTLVAQWIHQLPAGEVAVAWFSVDGADNDVVHFFAYVSGALQKAWPELDSIVPELLKSAQTPAPRAILTLLINEIAAVPVRFLLVLDDYHLITSAAIHDGVAFLVQNMPSNLSLVLTSRSDLPFPLARLRARRELVELRVADLRFSVGETEMLFNQTMDLALRQDDIVLLERRTEGWITGLQLAALALQGISTSQEQTRFVQSFSGTHRFVLDYLMEEVLAQQSADVQAFLRETAILDRLTAPLCDLLTGRENSQTMLESLAQTNLFLLPQDDDREWYRYHRLFADLLRARGQNDPHQSEQHRRAAAWFEEHGFVSDAFEHWLHAGAPVEAAALLEAQAMALLTQGYTGTLLSWTDRLPPEVVDSRPWLVIFQAWALLLTGLASDAVNRLRQVAPTASPGMAGHMAAIQGYAAALRGDMPAATDLLAKASAQLDPDDLTIRSVVSYVLGGICLMTGEFLAAQSAFLQAAQSAQDAENRHVAVPAWCAVASLQRDKGQLRRAEDTFRKALALATTPSGRLLPMAAQPHNGLAQLAYERNELQEAQALLDKGRELVKLWHNPDTKVHNLLTRASCMPGAGRDQRRHRRVGTGCRFC